METKKGAIAVLIDCADWLTAHYVREHYSDAGIEASLLGDMVEIQAETLLEIPNLVSETKTDRHTFSRPVLKLVGPERERYSKEWDDFLHGRKQERRA